MWTAKNRGRYDREHLTETEWKLVEPLIHRASAAAASGRW